MAPSGECLRGYKPGAADCSRLAPSCGSFLPVLNPVVDIPGLRAGTCAVLRGSLLSVSVSKCACHLSNKELLYFTLLVIIFTLFARLCGYVTEAVLHSTAIDYRGVRRLQNSQQMTLCCCCAVVADTTELTA